MKFPLEDKTCHRRKPTPSCVLEKAPTPAFPRESDRPDELQLDACPAHQRWITSNKF